MEELDLTVDSLDAVPEPLRALYAEQDGKFRLKVKGVEDTGGLKSALEKERQAKRDLEKKVKRWEALGKSDEEIADLIRKHDEGESERLKAAGDFEAAIKRERDRWTKERETLEARLNAAEASERKAIISTQLLASLGRAGATDEGLELLPDRLAGRIKLEIQDGERVVRIMGPDGVTPMARADGSDASFDDLVAEVTAKYPSLFKGEGRTGGGMRPNNGAGGSGGKKRSEMTERERAAYVEKHGLDAYKRLPL